MSADTPPRRDRWFKWLVAGSIGQIAGRLLDLRWHMTNDEFEGGIQQVQAHWLMWVATAFVLVVAFLALKESYPRAERLGYRIVLGANLAFVGVSVVHFLQHLDHREVDWSHLLLAVSNTVAVAGVVWVIAARRRSPEVAA